MKQILPSKLFDHAQNMQKFKIFERQREEKDRITEHLYKNLPLYLYIKMKNKNKK